MPNCSLSLDISRLIAASSFFSRAAALFLRFFLLAFLSSSNSESSNSCLSCFWVSSFFFFLTGAGFLLFFFAMALPVYTNSISIMGTSCLPPIRSLISDVCVTFTTLSVGASPLPVTGPPTALIKSPLNGTATNISGHFREGCSLLIHFTWCIIVVVELTGF